MYTNLAVPSLEVAKRLGLKVVKLKALCPFHPEATPSLSLSATKPVYHCFGCNAKGTSLQLASRVLGVSTSKARQWLMDEAIATTRVRFHGSSIDTRSRKLAPKLSESSPLFDRLLGMLPLRERGLAYLKDRNVGAAACRHFGFKEFVPASDKDAIRQSFDLSERDSMGLLTDAGALLWYRPLLLIPCLESGRIRYVQARALDDRTPRYLNLKGLSKPVFNVDVIANLRPGARLAVCEGVFDVVAAFGVGLPAIAALGAAALPPSVIARLRNVDVLLFPDRDDGGDRFVEANQAAFRQAGKMVDVMRVPLGKDLADWVRLVGGV